MYGFSNLLIPAVLFFALGFLARIIRSDLRFPPDLAKALSIYLLMAIGIHGGYELGHAQLLTALNAVFWAIVLGLTLPVIGYFVLVSSRKVDALNAAGSASSATTCAQTLTNSTRAVFCARPFSTAVSCCWPARC